MKQFVDEFWVYCALAPSVALAFLAYFVWHYTYQISVGHNHAGMVGFFSVVLFDLVMAFAPDFTYKVLPFFMLGITIWMGRFVYWMRYHPIPIEHLHNGNKADGIPVGLQFLPKLAFLEYMDQPMKERTWWHKPEFRYLGVFLSLIWLGAFGFTRSVGHIVEGDKRVAHAYENVGALYSRMDELDKNLAAASSLSVKEGDKRLEAIIAEIASVGDILLELKSDKSISRNQYELLERRYKSAQQQKQDLLKRKTIIVSPQPITNPNLPGGLKTLPTDLNKVNFNYKDVGFDSTAIWAKHDYNPDAQEEGQPYYNPNYNDQN